MGSGDLFDRRPPRTKLVSAREVRGGVMSLAHRFAVKVLNTIHSSVVLSRRCLELNTSALVTLRLLYISTENLDEASPGATFGNGAMAAYAEEGGPS